MLRPPSCSGSYYTVQCMLTCATLMTSSQSSGRIEQAAESCHNKIVSGYGSHKVDCTDAKPDWMMLLGCPTVCPTVHRSLPRFVCGSWFVTGSSSKRIGASCCSLLFSFKNYSYPLTLWTQAIGGVYIPVSHRSSRTRLTVHPATGL